jgi:3',5'-cyclic AMP phosphodiesterase CpdA
MTKHIVMHAVLALAILMAPRQSLAEEEQPICRIAAISNLYLTTLSKQELGSSRSFIEYIAPAGIKRTIEAVNSLEPDALVVLGSLTWTGSDADFQKAKEALAAVKVPLHIVPGPNDLKDGGLERFRRHFEKENVAGQSVNVRNVHLEFGTWLGERTAQAQTELLDGVVSRLSKSGDAKAVLLFEGPDFRATPDPATAPPKLKSYWKTIHDRHVAVRFVPTHAHYVAYEDSLPIWGVPSSGWSYSPKFSVALITVYEKQIELTLMRDPDQPVQSLVIPNPVAADRMPTAAEDPYGVPTYSEDLARKPDLTFVQLSDSQFDDKTVPRYKARYAYDEQMNELVVAQVNRLNPQLAFMTGDLTNKNTEAEWKTFGRIYGKLKPPLYAMPGNHDTLYDRTKLDKESLGDLLETGLSNWKLADELAGKTESDRTALFRHFMQRKPYYAVEKNGCVFLCLNTGVASVDKEQMQWLRDELERTKDADHVFVLGHYPVLPAFGNSIQGPEAQEILTLLREYRVTAYLSGHRHRYDYRMHDGVMHMLCDCLCWGEYRSYQVYHVYPDHIDACWKPIFRADGNRPLYERVSFPEPRFSSK